MRRKIKSDNYQTYIASIPSCKRYSLYSASSLNAGKNRVDYIIVCRNLEEVEERIDELKIGREISPRDILVWGLNCSPGEINYNARQLNYDFLEQVDISQEKREQVVRGLFHDIKVRQGKSLVVRDN